MLDSGERVARPGDEILVCEIAHATGPITWHLDLDCYCAPDGVPAEQVSEYVGGACTLDKPHPTLADTSGACRFGRCAHHLGVD